uniref:OPT family oligopeptide transporter n=1 Tax=Ignisphaera aggregans TaxID=334771 RepID=A0A7C5UVJ0_9CREN
MGSSSEYHPKLYEPALLVMGALIGVLGAIIGVELIVRVGINPNTSIIGALIAIGVGYLPSRLTRRYFLNVHRINIIQTVISGATFTAGNVLLLGLAIVWIAGEKVGLLLPYMIYGALIGLVFSGLVDLILAYKIFDSPFYPASNPWPIGVSTALSIRAGLERGKKALLLLYGAIVGTILTYFKYPGDVMGIALIGNVWAISMFGIGLILRAYSPQWFGVDLYKMYAPHGIMIGAGIAAILQFVILYIKVRGRSSSQESSKMNTLVNAGEALRSIGVALALWLLGAAVLAFGLGLHNMMGLGHVVAWIIYFGVGALWTTLVCALSGMHAGWFPAFATALATLMIGLLLGFPPIALAIGAAYVAATGPGMADLSYDLKAGWMLRGEGKDPKFERAGRFWQFLAEIAALIIALAIVSLVYTGYFSNNLFPPAAKTLATASFAAADPELLRYILMWAPIGFIIQLVGGPEKQIGILFATGLMILNPMAGVVSLATIAARIILYRIFRERVRDIFFIGGSGSIAGSALTSFLLYTLPLILR